jgi:hypothetical protein
LSEFNDRLNAQRLFLSAVNSVGWPVEPLYSLAIGAIERWVSVNELSMADELVQLVKLAGRALSFLANHSQQQITEDYEHRQKTFAELTHRADLAVKKIIEGKS